VVDTLNDYEAAQVAEIAAWKGEEPGAISRTLRKVRAPLGRLIGRTIPKGMIRSLAEKSGRLVEHHDGLREVAREAGVGDVTELRNRALRECDRLAVAVSTRAQFLAMAEGAAAGVGGFVTELGNIPVLLAAAERAIRRVGHCYGYRLEGEPERTFVLNVLELATADDPVSRRLLRDRLPAGPQTGDSAPGLDGMSDGIINDMLLEVVPIFGDAASVALDYAFMRRVDVTARRVFQERWLRDHGKVAPIAPSPAHSPRRAAAVRAARELAAEVAYLGGYGVGFVATVPYAAASALGSRLPPPVVLGATQGARDATASAGEFAAGWRSTAAGDGAPVGLAAGSPA
jgi:EcsC protein family